jgi:hypothetical protein
MSSQGRRRRGGHTRRASRGRRRHGGPTRQGLAPACKRAEEELLVARAWTTWMDEEVGRCQRRGAGKAARGCADPA